MEALNKKQEEAICEMYRGVGFDECYSIINKYMIERFGKQHKHTINLRLLIQPIQYKMNEEKRSLIDESKLTDLFCRRIDESKPPTE